jgi:hypothetical protein
MPFEPGEVPVRFGRYEGAPLSFVLADRAYMKWLLMQPWLPRKHPDLHARVARAMAEPPTMTPLGPPMQSFDTGRELSAWFDANVPERDQRRYRILHLEMDDDPSRLYVYLQDRESVVYYAVHEETGIIKIGTSRDVDSRVRALKNCYSPDGWWRLLGFELGGQKLERQRHLEFREHAISHGPDGVVVREIFKPGTDLLAHIESIVAGCRRWPRPTEPRTGFGTEVWWNRVVLEDRPPRSELTTEGLSEDLTAYMKGVSG